MIETGTRPLRANRWTPFVHTIDFEGFDFTGAAFAMHCRLYRDAAGDPVIGIANAAAGSEGISVAVGTIDGVPTSTVTLRINETTLEPVLLNAGKAGADANLVWDLHVTPEGQDKVRWLEGAFVISAGSTQ